MVKGYLLAESMRPGSSLEGLELKLTRVERYPVASATAAQPSVWTAIEFEFEEQSAASVADALARVLDEEGGWYTNFSVGKETFVIFANRVFRYTRGDRDARAEAAEHARALGVPEAQLDWSE
jgi:hypothetical protein